MAVGVLWLGGTENTFSGDGKFVRYSEREIHLVQYVFYVTVHTTRQHATALRHGAHH